MYPMGYYLDLDTIGIIEYKNKLLNSNLVPSRIILKDNIDKYFQLIESINVSNVKELLDKIKILQSEASKISEPSKGKDE